MLAHYIHRGWFQRWRTHLWDFFPQIVFVYGSGNMTFWWCADVGVDPVSILSCEAMHVSVEYHVFLFMPQGRWTWDMCLHLTNYNADTGESTSINGPYIDPISTSVAHCLVWTVLKRKLVRWKWIPNAFHKWGGMRKNQCGSRKGINCCVLPFLKSSIIKAESVSPLVSASAIHDNSLSLHQV
jgi:hypothetical protein